MSAAPVAGMPLTVCGPPAVVAVAETELRALGAIVGAARPAGKAALAGPVDAALGAGLPRGPTVRASGSPSRWPQSSCCRRSWKARQGRARRHPDRRRAAAGCAPDLGAPGDVVSRRGGEGAPLVGVDVVDLAAIWAGPLTAWLLAALTTVEAPVRPDGMRSQPATFAALDRGKQRVAFDLRDEHAHRELVVRVREADVLLDSFSARVMPNLGLARHQLVDDAHPLVATPITAFAPATREDGWVDDDGRPHHPFVIGGSG